MHLRCDHWYVNIQGSGGGIPAGSLRFSDCSRPPVRERKSEREREVDVERERNRPETRREWRISSCPYRSVQTISIRASKSHYLTDKSNRANRLQPPAPDSLTHLPPFAAAAIRTGDMCAR